jgi:tRNA A37 threonylcarbamoyltransferase TsaD
MSDEQKPAAEAQKPAAQKSKGRPNEAAIKKAQPTALTIVGGVSANRELLRVVKERLGGKVRVMEPARGLHTDNAAMIAAAGAWKLRKGKKDNWKKLDADPEIDL